MVFVLVEGGKAFAAKSRGEAEQMHLEIVALMKSLLRVVPGGYFVRQQDGDLKYLVAFSSSEASFLWCLAVQEAMMYLKWSPAVLHNWKEERAGDGSLLFRGPRLKMGICEGLARSILPDHMGRADYHGTSINQAARFMDAAAHGGMIACEEALARRVMENWVRSQPPDTQSSVATSWQQQSISVARSGLITSAIKSSVTFARPSQMAAKGDTIVEEPEGEISEGGGQSRLNDLTSPSFIQATSDISSIQALRSPPPPAVASQLNNGVSNEDMFDGELRVFSNGNNVISLSESATVPSTWVEATALFIGQFKFKGSEELFTMVNMTLSPGRKFPAEPPKGKGGRIATGQGVSGSCRIPLLRVVDFYYQKYYETLDVTQRRIAKQSVFHRLRSMISGVRDTADSEDGSQSPRNQQLNLRASSLAVGLRSGLSRMSGFFGVKDSRDSRLNARHMQKITLNDGRGRVSDAGVDPNAASSSSSRIQGAAVRSSIPKKSRTVASGLGQQVLQVSFKEHELEVAERV